MKKMILTCVALFVFFSAFSQKSQYAEAMAQAIEQLYAAEGKSEILEAANLFERIAGARPEEWLPAYYHAYAQMLLAMASMDEQHMEQCQAHVDKAQASLDKALAAGGENSEILALQGLAYQGRIWEDMQANGAEFSMKSHKALDKAIALDQQNPRAYYLKGQNIFFTPPFYGGGPEAALPLLEKAERLFAAAEPGSALAPRWGRESNQWLLDQARGDKNEEKD